MEGKHRFSYGEQAVRLTLKTITANEQLEIDYFKQETSRIINELHVKRKTSQSTEQKALLTLAIRKYQEAIRDTVFAITHEDIDLLN